MLSDEFYVDTESHRLQYASPGKRHRYQKRDPIEPGSEYFVRIVGIWYVGVYELVPQPYPYYRVIYPDFQTPSYSEESYYRFRKFRQLSSKELRRNRLSNSSK
jgi:hypothetical protein